VEYMAMGRAVVSFDLVETRVSAGDAAVYVEDNDELEFARAIDDLLKDPERRQRMGELGRRRVEQELSWELSRRNLTRFYHRFLDADIHGSSRPRASVLQWPNGGTPSGDVNQRDSTAQSTAPTGPLAG
ncbi:MAG: glycosyltransferase, partial [Myxococcota bacterium]